jgi:hypothetical protein
MSTRTQRLATILAIGGLSLLGAGAASAQQAAWNGGGTEAVGSSTSPAAVGALSRDAVYNEAVTAAHTTSSEAVGQSTGAPAMVSTISPEAVSAGAVAAAHPTTTEATGQSTVLPLPGSATQ